MDTHQILSAHQIHSASASGSGLDLEPRSRASSFSWPPPEWHVSGFPDWHSPLLFAFGKPRGAKKNLSYSDHVPWLSRTRGLKTTRARSPRLCPAILTETPCALQCLVSQTAKCPTDYERNPTHAKLNAQNLPLGADQIKWRRNDLLYPVDAGLSSTGSVLIPGVQNKSDADECCVDIRF